MLSQIEPDEQGLDDLFPSGRLAVVDESSQRTKIVLGIDTENMYVWAVDLLSRMRFQEPLLTLFHAANRDCPIPQASPSVVAEYVRFVEDLGSAGLTKAERYVSSQGIEAKTKMSFGRAANAMIVEADENAADLIALCAVKHGYWSTGYMGSATCALALYAKQSLLVAKTSIRHNNPLRAVFAIDNSSKTQEIVELFLKMAPVGIEDILIVSAYGLNEEAMKAAEANFPEFSKKYNDFQLEDNRTRNKAIASQLESFGFHVTTEAVCASPNSAIQEAMQNFQADLLIVGATGMESMPNGKIGSVALHQISSEKYSVLMLRN